MAEFKDLLKISYERIKETIRVKLTANNCQEYGYIATTKEIEGVNKTVFYKQGETVNEYIPLDENGDTIIEDYIYEKHEHIAPPCSTFKVSFADVDKEGSGRNSLTGEMYRERIGSYMKLDLAWDLIPNTIEYNNWYNVLTHLPPFFEAELLLPDGQIYGKKFYRTDVLTDLYLFVSDRQIWKGLSTSFVQANLDEYDDTYEPDMVEVTDDGLVSNPIFENGDNIAYGD